MLKGQGRESLFSSSGAIILQNNSIEELAVDLDLLLSDDTKCINIGKKA